ncbi:MAG: Ig-like domain-containing protein [Lachnospiraceae bacterium]|nr:Ig-like domain-containing protein [Lachnospiraceae bacterium]
MTNSKKTQRLVALLLVLSLLIPLMNYYKQSVKADSTKTTTTTTSSTIGEISATDEVELVEDFTNSPVLKYVNAESFVKNNHVKRLKDEEELNTYMFKNADGTKTMYMMYENVKYIDKFGNVKDKDISLKLDNDVYKVTDNNVALSIPKAPQNGIEVNYDNNIVKITPSGNASESKIVTTMENNAVTYKNYYGEGIDLRYTPLLSGVKEDIILSEYTGQEYKFTLETNGLNIYEKEGRYYLAKDEQSESIYDIGEVLVYDAVGRPTTGMMLITTKEAGKTYEISISVSDEYLKDSATVYPVTIDPTVTISDNINGAGAIEDAPVFSGLSTAACGNYTYLSAGYVDSTYKIGRVLVRTPGLYNSTAYQNATMDDIVSVKFYCKDGSGNAASYVNLYPNISNSTWNENTVSWATGCNFTTSVNYGTTMSFGTWTSFDITHLVRAWRSGYYTYKSNMGFTLTNSNETSTAYRKAIFSSEYGVTTDRPYVEMTYNSVLDISLPRGMVSIGGTQQINYTVTAPGGTFSWSSSDDDIATVTNAGVVIGYSEGVAVITATYTYVEDGITYVSTDEVSVKVIDRTGVEANEEYFIYNKLSKAVLTINGNATGNAPGKIDHTLVVTLTNEELGAHSSAWTEASKWKLIDEGQGLYSLRNVYASIGNGYNLDMCLDVSTTTLDIYHYDGGNYLKFNIWRCNTGGMINLSTLLEDTNPQELGIQEPAEVANYKKGLYLISYNNMYLTSDQYGNVSMTNTITDGSYWSFSVAGDKNVKIDYTKTALNIDTSGIVTALKGQDTEGINYYNLIFGENMPDEVACENSNAETILEHLSESNLYMYRGHGFSGGLMNIRDIVGTQDTEPISFLLANRVMQGGSADIDKDGNGSITGEERGVSFNEAKEENKYVNEVGSNAFANAGIVLFIGCSTGTDYLYDDDSNSNTPKVPYNLLEETYKKGAHLVIGTTQTMTPDESHTFAIKFFANIKTQTQRNMPIKECLKRAIEETIGEKSQLADRFVLIGDINQCFEYGTED